MAYYNSTIKQKQGYCIDCPETEPKKYVIAGRCPYHYQSYKRKVYAGRALEETNSNKILVSKEEQDLWFEERIIELSQKPYCLECGAFIPPEFYRHAVAHIFPKNIFQSVATHRWNYIFVGAGCGCHDKTHRVDTFSKMKIFPIAVVRFMEFAREITERHKYKTLFFDAANGLLTNEL